VLSFSRLPSCCASSILYACLSGGGDSFYTHPSLYIPFWRRRLWRGEGGKERERRGRREEEVICSPFYGGGETIPFVMGKQAPDIPRLSAHIPSNCLLHTHVACHLPLPTWREEEFSYLPAKPLRREPMGGGERRHIHTCMHGCLFCSSSYILSGGDLHMLPPLLCPASSLPAASCNPSPVSLWRLGCLCGGTWEERKGFSAFYVTEEEGCLPLPQSLQDTTHYHYHTPHLLPGGGASAVLPHGRMCVYTVFWEVWEGGRTLCLCVLYH